ncbi:MAG: KamA family radical SAM protein, partial [Syntrophales bacterium]|nr:KamA family radical SAM protein [Syntrophales bacterium]
PMAITPYSASLVAKPSPRDPIFLQCVPDARELCGTEHEDPLGEEDHQPVDHLIQRYADRCVVMVTDTCAVHCRHCNRKRYWRRRRGGLKERDLTKICAYISQTPSLREIIISGGDPLTLSDEKVETILGNIKKISHVEVIRLGSRVPVTLPMRITPDLCRLLRHFRPLWFNTQFNHPQEITPEAATACERLVSAGIPVSNQSVLLKGINDDGETLKNLFYGLQRMGVRPYYLFQAEPVRGAGHFQVDVKKGMAIMEALRREISGLCLPRYVMDTGGVMGKLPLQGHRDCTDEGWQSRQFPLTKQDK